MAGIASYVSTGALPPRKAVGALVAEAHARFAGDRSGAPSPVYPALAAAPPDAFGICVVSTTGAVTAAGDADARFTIMSVSKPFVFALVCDALGPDEARARLGVNATGLPFNSLAAVEQTPGGRTNPMVNAGAIAATSHVPGDGPQERFEAIRDKLSRCAGRDLEVDEDVHACALTTNAVNRAIAQLLAARGALGCPPDEAVELYTRQCALEVSARDLAVMGATLADGGVNPVTGERVVAQAVCHPTLAVMLTAGLYETSGDWLYDVGLPAKSGIGGGIVTVSPGKAGLGTYGPRLDAAGNSVKGTLAARFLSQALGMDLLVSAPQR